MNTKKSRTSHGGNTGETLTTFLLPNGGTLPATMHTSRRGSSSSTRASVRASATRRTQKSSVTWHVLSVWSSFGVSISTTPSPCRRSSSGPRDFSPHQDRCLRSTAEGMSGCSDAVGGNSGRFCTYRCFIVATGCSFACVPRISPRRESHLSLFFSHPFLATARSVVSSARSQRFPASRWDA